MGQRYAVLISGDLAENGYPEFFFDVVLMREALIANGFPANHIFVLYGDGADYNNAFYPAARYRPNPAITDLAATSANVQAIFSDLANGTNGRPQLTNDDLLFVWTFDHGDQIPTAPGSATLISTLGLRGGDMRADDFATAINVVPHAFRIVCMQQCRSGGFIPHLASDRTVILTAAQADRNAHPSDDAAERETINGRIYPHGEFNFYLLAAMNGQDLLGNAMNADANGNGFTTMREVFDFIIANESDSATPQYDDGSRNLGERLHLAFADLFMRDNLNDGGAEPSPGGGLSLSPDINHFRNELLDPQATLLSPAAMANGTLFEKIEIGQPNYIYVRVRNRGYSASDATVDLFWTLPTTLPTPTSWNSLGSVAVPAVALDSVAVGGPLIWAEGIPAAGHYCFVALLRNAQDPAPDLASVTDSASFYDLIRLNNNVVWKNFDVDNLFAGGYARVEFQIQGWPRHALSGDLEIDLSALPAGISGEFRLVRRLLEGAELQGLTEIATTQLYAKLGISGSTVGLIRNMPLQPSDSTEGILQLTLPDGIPDGAYDISVRQLVYGTEMGRITRRFAVGAHPFTGNRNTFEVHRSNCEWVRKMSGRNKVAYSDADLAIKHGYNGCHYCLRELSTD
jgi:hypothetical protein